MAPEESRVVIHRYLEEFNKGNVDYAAEFFDANVVGHEPGGDLRGREEVKLGLAGFRAAFPNIQVKIDEVVAEGEMAVVRWTFHGRQEGEVLGIAPTGKHVTVTGMIIYHIADGKIMEYWGSWDRLSLVRQLSGAHLP